MALFTVPIQSDDSWGPLNVKIIGQRFLIISYSDGNYSILQKITYFVVGIRNRIHLLTTDSSGIEKIQDDIFLLSLPAGHRLLKVGFPFEFKCHVRSSPGG
jgi:hypothetical protein